MNARRIPVVAELRDDDFTFSATPSSSVSVSFQMLGGEATKSEPSCQAPPIGKVILSANTVDLSNLPSLSVSDSIRIELGASKHRNEPSNTT